MPLYKKSISEAPTPTVTKSDEIII